MIGSELAKANREKEIIIWLAQRDQNVVGRGTVGFDLDEMPWIEDDFPEMKEFMLSTIIGVINRTQWDVLNYEPNDIWRGHPLDVALLGNLMNKVQN
ncbi:hypothetical protein SAMN04488542_11769 [Fontibacillus panacisegetis]|uniref:Uncharacterized protein n=1 Tax=Fontibacillus panacisegetis TaxID=670482 RepID=A0A1G7P2D1_9BACL|nr:hypothetical protein [Fontibacillus panacisegetis]SDF79769.1 hypothetical protein SAMN04488542_11769 [Fontibacillus panacisegetis]